jgi:hypothetical protein
VTPYIDAAFINSNSPNESILEKVNSLISVDYSREISLIILIYPKVSYSKAITLY